MTDGLHALAYKVLTADEFAVLETGVFDGAPIDLHDGFIHLSTAEQLTETVKRHFADRHDLVIAAVNLAALGDAVRWEISRGGQLFPHLYAPLSRSAVVGHGALEWRPDGSVQLPGS